MLPHYVNLPYESLPLTTGTGERMRAPYSSGLNWGQRPGRNPDQAYLAVPSQIQKNNFFPEPGQIFIIETADGDIWRCARRQANGKAIHTIDDNAILGKYFRRKLGLPYGSFVTLSHLLRYGKTTVDIYKKSEYKFILDFESYS